MCFSLLPTCDQCAVSFYLYFFQHEQWNPDQLTFLVLCVTSTGFTPFSELGSVCVHRRYRGLRNLTCRHPPKHDPVPLTPQCHALLNRAWPVTAHKGSTVTTFMADHRTSPPYWNPSLCSFQHGLWISDPFYIPSVVCVFHRTCTSVDLYLYSECPVCVVGQQFIWGPPATLRSSNVASCCHSRDLRIIFPSYSDRRPFPLLPHQNVTLCRLLFNRMDRLPLARNSLW